MSKPQKGHSKNRGSKSPESKSRDSKGQVSKGRVSIVQAKKKTKNESKDE